MASALVIVNQRGESTSLGYLPNAVKAAAITQCAGVTSWPANYYQALNQYSQLITMWSYTNNFPAYDGTLFPEEAAYLHWLFYDIVNPGTNSYYNIQGNTPAEISTTGTQLTVTGTGALAANASLTAPLTINTFKITIADLPLRSLKRPWHPFVLRELALRTALKNV